MLQEFPIQTKRQRIRGTESERLAPRWANAHDCMAVLYVQSCLPRPNVLCTRAHQVLLADGIFTRPLTIRIRYLHTVVYATAYSSAFMSFIPTTMTTTTTSTAHWTPLVRWSLHMCCVYACTQLSVRPNRKGRRPICVAANLLKSTHQSK